MFFLLNKTVLLLNGNVGAMLAQLTKGPVDCPSVRRNSAYVHRLRKAGVNIYTELVRGAVGTSYGIYHLKSSVRRMTAAEVAALRAEAKAKAAKARKVVAK
jgi:hypothetical protein